MTVSPLMSALQDLRDLTLPVALEGKTMSLCSHNYTI